MKTMLTIISLLFSFGVLHAQTWTLIPEKCEVIWTGYGEIGNFAQTGTLEISQGDLTYNDQKKLSGQIKFDLTSIDHEDQNLEKHLKAKDFFHVKKYPNATFDLTQLSKNQATGNLTIKGKTNSVSFEIDSTQLDSSFIIQGSLSIDRTKFDIKYNSNSFFQDLGNYAIKNEFDLTFKLYFYEE